jgi:hypothetical protein
MRAPLDVPNLGEVPDLFGIAPLTRWSAEAHGVRGGRSSSSQNTMVSRPVTPAGGGVTVHHRFPGFVYAFDLFMLPVITDEVIAPSKRDETGSLPRQTMAQLLVRSEIERLVRAWSAIAMINPTFDFAEEMMERWGASADAVQRANRR